MTEGGEIVPVTLGPSAEKKRLPLAVQRVINHLDGLKKEKKILTENEAALARMSEIAWKIRDFFDNEDYQNQEKQENDFSLKTPTIQGHRRVVDQSGTRWYSIDTTRDFHTKEVTMIEVYQGLTDIENAENHHAEEGYTRIYIDKDYKGKKLKKGQRERLIWSNTSAHGGAVLGQETSEILADISVSHLSTRVDLRGVSFGGWPSIHVSLLTTAKDSAGNFLGPVGKVNEMQVLGISRAMSPIKDRISNTASVSIPIDGEFSHYDQPFVFDRGEANFQAAKTLDKQTGKELLSFRFSGIRKRFSGDRERPNIVGPEEQSLAVPIELTNAHKVIGVFEKSIERTIKACEQKPQLTAGW